MFLPKLNHAMVCLIPKVNEEENTFLTLSFSGE